MNMGDENEESSTVQQYRTAATEALRLAGMPVAGALATDDEVAEYLIDNFPRVRPDPRNPLTALMGLVRGIAGQLQLTEEQLLNRADESARKAEHDRETAAARQREKDLAAMRPSERMMLGVLEEMRDLFRKHYDPPTPARTLREAVGRAEEQLEKQRLAKGDK